jgi:hypothetical protein
MLENRVLGGIFGPDRDKWQEAGEDSVMRSFITFVLHLHITKMVK